MRASRSWSRQARIALNALNVALALEASAATLVTYDPLLRDAASSQGLFVAMPDETV